MTCNREKMVTQFGEFIQACFTGNTPELQGGREGGNSLLVGQAQQKNRDLLGQYDRPMAKDPARLEYRRRDIGRGVTPPRTAREWLDVVALGLLEGRLAFALIPSTRFEISLLFCSQLNIPHPEWQVGFVQTAGNEYIACNKNLGR